MIRRFIRMTFRTRHFANDIARIAALVVARDARRGRLGRFERHDGRDVRRVESGLSLIHI